MSEQITVTQEASQAENIEVRHQEALEGAQLERERLADPEAIRASSRALGESVMRRTVGPDGLVMTNREIEDARENGAPENPSTRAR